MKRNIIFIVTILFSMALSGVSIACQGQALAKVPAAVADTPVKAQVTWVGSYKGDIQPIFNDWCVSCHGPDRVANGLRLDSYEGVMKGTQYGRVVIPGEPGGSTLLRILYLTPNPRVHMPYGNAHLRRNHIENINMWIQAGARND